MDIVIDTNIILHFRRVDECDWRAVAGGDACAIIVTPVLMRELERNKVHNPNASLRQRARATVAWLAERMEEPDPIRLRDGALLVFDEQEPLIDFAEYRLSRDMADDHLIASALDRAKRTGHDVAIATADAGVALKLRSRPIRLLRPDDAWRLPNAVDAERQEIRDLKRELERERNRRPRLELQFEGGGSKIALSPDAPEPYPPIDAVRAELPQMTLADYSAADERREPGVRIYQHGPVDRYNEELETYFGEYETFLVRHAAWAEQEARTIELAFVLANSGSAPASNIDIVLEFPNHLDVLAADDGLEEPSPPDPPDKPRPDRGVASMMRAFALGGPHPRPVPLRDGEPAIPTDQRRAEYRIGALKHACAFALDPVLVIFPSREHIRPFTIHVSITCNESDKIEGKLVVLAAADDVSGVTTM